VDLDEHRLQRDKLDTEIPGQRSIPPQRLKALLRAGSPLLDIAVGRQRSVPRVDPQRYRLLGIRRTIAAISDRVFFVQVPYFSTVSLTGSNCDLRTMMGPGSSTGNGPTSTFKRTSY